MGKRLSIIAVTALVLFSVYTITAHSVASKYIIEDESGLYWRTSPPGSLLPWPRAPGELQALSDVNALDALAYTYLIRSMALITLSLLAWIVVGMYYALKLIKLLKT